MIPPLANIVGQDVFYLTIYLFLDRRGIATLRACCRLFNQKIPFQSQQDLFLLKMSQENFSIQQGMKRNDQYMHWFVNIKNLILQKLSFQT